MYIDFKDPEKTDINKKITSKSKNKKPLFSFKKKKIKSNLTSDTNIKEVKHTQNNANLQREKEPHEEINILDKINRTIEKEAKKIEVNRDISDMLHLDKLDEKSAKDATVILNKKNSDLLEPIDNSNADSKTTIPNTPPPIPKIGKAGFIPFEFRGNAKEYFKIWIVNIALSILTLGIYSAWAKVRSLRYIYGNTYLNNSNFEFNADPKRILIGRIIIVSFYILFLLFSDYLAMYKIAAGIFVGFLLLLPWLIRQAISFKLKSASYRNIPFKFHAKVRSFYWLVIVGFFTIISLPLTIAILSKISPIIGGTVVLAVAVIVCGVVYIQKYRWV